MSTKKSNEKNAKAGFAKNIKTTLDAINLDPKQIKFLINIKNENLSYKILLTPNKPQTFLGGCLNVPSDFLDYIEFLKTNPS